MAATTAVRNSVRTVAERVLSSPGVRGGRPLVGDDAKRRELTALIATEVMTRRANSAAQLTALSLMVTARHAVEVVRAGRPAGGAAHLPPQMVVSISLAAEGLPPAVRSAYQQHVEGCSACTEDVRIVAAAAKVQATAAHAEPIPEPTPDAGEKGAQELEALFSEAVAEQEERDGPAPASAEAPRRETPTFNTARPFEAARRAPPPKPRGPGVPLVGAAVVGGLLWWAFARRAPTVDPAARDAFAALAIRTPPTLPAGVDLGPEAVEAERALAEGDCPTAAARLRTARRRDPTRAALWVLEGAAQVCAGDGLAAREALEGLPETVTPPADTTWYLAQALLLSGDGRAALEALSEVQEVDPAHSAQALSQAGALRDLL